MQQHAYELRYYFFPDGFNVCQPTVYFQSEMQFLHIVGFVVRPLDQREKVAPPVM